MSSTAAVLTKHVATSALLGAYTGKRVGTRYYHTYESALKAHAEPGFRWRNEDCRHAALAVANTIQPQEHSDEG